MVKFFKQKNKGFVILFAVTISAILLAVALGVSNIALKQVNFSTSAKSTNDAFFASDTGAECALYNDKSTFSNFTVAGPAKTFSCAGSSITPNFSGTSNTGTYTFTVPNLGSTSSSCAKVVVTKDNSAGPTATNIDSKGYNIGDSACASTNTNRTEREVQLSYNVTNTPIIDGVCSATHFSCVTSGASTNQAGSGPWTWNCPGSGGGATASCSESLVFNANGGTITYTDAAGANPRSSPPYVGGYTVHTFTGSGTFTINSGSANISYLIVAGGGSGGTADNGGAGGGGAGGLKTGTVSLSAGSYTVTVGNGGSSAASGHNQGNNGVSSAFNGITSLGGGGGGSNNTGGPNGLAGGSGGGAGYNGYATAVVGIGTAGQGNNGGQNGDWDGNGVDAGGGAGGGAGGTGFHPTNSPHHNGGVGGNGVTSSISGTSATYGVGGNGGGWPPGSSGTSGAANTGNGGGGSYGGGSDGAGGSGIVIIRYPTP